MQPQLIPDEIAIRALLETLRIPPNPDSDALKQLHARVNRVNLSDADIDVLVSELEELDTQAKEQQARVDAVRPSSAADRAAIDQYLEERANLDAVFVDQYQGLLASLSPQGAAKLEAHLLHVKSRIKVYPSPDMSGGN